MCDNPLHVAAIGDVPERRVRVLQRVFSWLLALSGRPTLGAWDGDRLVGVADSAEPGRCQPSLREGVRLATDKTENVRLYERFGFVVTAEADVIGVKNWFMTRQAIVSTTWRLPAAAVPRCGSGSATVTTRGRRRTARCSPVAPRCGGDPAGVAGNPEVTFLDQGEQWVHRRARSYHVLAA